jgi:hypothetical protein
MQGFNFLCFITLLLMHSFVIIKSGTCGHTHSLTHSPSVQNQLLFWCIKGQLCRLSFLECHKCNSRGIIAQLHVQWSSLIANSSLVPRCPDLFQLAHAREKIGAPGDEAKLIVWRCDGNTNPLDHPLMWSLTTSHDTTGPKSEKNSFNSGSLICHKCKSKLWIICTGSNHERQCMYNMYPVAYVSNKESAGIVIITTRSASSRTVQLCHVGHQVIFADLADFYFTQLILPFGLLE